ncbi:UDP-glucose 4-epimerase [Amycolatopsis marina]|uniref:UDP-glucose 4-epimerase n=1 Tax=Amycolatopsis marina TaxID=490629 RepID=A0A1I0ZNI8_9PSEU|nr:NAD-dependent epimerase/dehydratase family protein [Amycolatopsis marina]SFB25948.1 UDP-glucose 4-epimerase [Amycolatopsis marina]
MNAAKTVVTGGGGFIGRHLVDRLLEGGADVTVFDGGPPNRPATAGHPRWVTGDVRDHAAVGRAITHGVDVVYHLAASVGVDQYLARPLDVIDVNFSGTRNVLERAREVGARVVVASTSEVFGKNPAVPWREDDDRVLGPTSADRWSYSTSKALAEHLVFAFVRQHQLEATIVRYFNVYGPGQRPAFVVSRTIHRVLNRRPVVIYDGGSQTRCFTFVDDAIDATIRVGADSRAIGEAFNIGSSVETRVADVVPLIVELAGGGTTPISVNTAERLGRGYEDLSRRIPDTTKAREVLGWSATTSLRDGLIKTIEWARASDWWLALPDAGAA